jgi:hypothetical protein
MFVVYVLHQSYCTSETTVFMHTSTVVYSSLLALVLSQIIGTVEQSQFES